VRIKFSFLKKFGIWTLFFFRVNFWRCAETVNFFFKFELELSLLNSISICEKKYRKNYGIFLHSSFVYAEKTWKESFKCKILERKLSGVFFQELKKIFFFFSESMGFFKKAFEGKKENFWSPGCQTTSRRFEFRI